MKIDLHIHTSTGSDGAMTVEEVLQEAKKRDIGVISITDHDSIAAQAKAITLARELGIKYITGIELNVSMQIPPGNNISLDFLGYGYDINNQPLMNKLAQMREHREWRAQEILRKINIEFVKEHIPVLTNKDMENIKRSVDGSFGRPHLAAYLVRKGIVVNTRQAFDKYLVKCDVPKFPQSLAEASKLIREAGGILILAHPNDPNGTSLRSVTTELEKQTLIIQENMLEYINGVECWHSRQDKVTSTHYLKFAAQNHLLFTGGSDCHQRPVIMGTVAVPETVIQQLNTCFKE
jgi:predicted metal-dependent phosphoesterase TrpH